MEQQQSQVPHSRNNKNLTNLKWPFAYVVTFLFTDIILDIA